MLPSDNFVISFCRNRVDQSINQGKCPEAGQQAEDEQSCIVHSEHDKQPANQREGKTNVHPGSDQRQEKYRDDLGMDTFFHLGFTHAHILHDLKAFFVIKALRNLFIVDYENRLHQEQCP